MWRAGAAVWRVGPMSVKSGDTGRHGEMRFQYDRWRVRESVDTGRHAVPQMHSNEPVELGYGKNLRSKKLFAMFHVPFIIAPARRCGLLTTPNWEFHFL